MRFVLRALGALGLAVLFLGGAQTAQAQPIFSKSFSPATIGPGGTSVLTFSIDNAEGSPVTGLGFTDSLPAGVSIASPAEAATTCPDATVSAPGGGGTIGFSGGRLGGGARCTVTVNTTATTPGSHVNVSGDLTSSAGNSGPASATLTVSGSVPGFSKSFVPASIPLFGRSTLTYTIDNATGGNVFNASFSETLPTGLVIASPAGSSISCVGSLTAAAGTSSISLFSGFLASQEICTITVDVTSAAAGSYVSRSGDLTSIAGNSGSSVAALEVVGPAPDGLQITKQFIDDPAVPGGSATLEFRLRNAARSGPATNVGFTDDLGAMLSGASAGAELFNDCGGTGSGSGTYSYGGGSIATGGDCTIRIAVNIPGGAGDGSYANTTSAITGTIGGAPVTGNTASDTLNVSGGVPQLTKSFASAITAGQNAVMQFTITNPSASQALTDLSFTDNLSAFLSGAALAGTPAPGFCGAGSQAFGTEISGDFVLNVSGANLPAGGSCSFSVTIATPASVPGGSYRNTTSPITGTFGGGTVVGPAASASLTINGGVPLRFAKAFTDGPADAGGTATLEFTIDNSEGAAPVTGIAFSDDLDAMLTGAQAVSALANTCGGMATGGFPASSFGYAGGTVAAGASCTITVSVAVPAGAATGDYVNTTAPLTADAGAGAGPATATLRVLGADDQPLLFSKEFLGGPFLPGEAATLRYTIENPNATTDATISLFTESLTTALSGLAATGPATTDTCGGALSGTTFLTYVGGSVLAGQTCTIEVPILVPAGAAANTYNSTSGSLTASTGTSDPASAALVVETALLVLTKAFTDDPVQAGSPATLQFNISNPSGVAVGNLSFSDDLGAMLPGAQAVSASANTCGGMATGGFPASSFGYAGGTLAPGASCVITIAVSTPAGAATGGYANTVSDLAGDGPGGVTITGNSASDTLQVRAADAPVFSKTFATGSVVPGQAETLSFTIRNPGAAALGNLSFSDDLDAMLTGATLSGVTANGCGGSVGGVGTGAMTFSGGSVAGMASCDIVLSVLTPASAPGGSHVNTSSALFSDGLEVAPAASDSLTVTPVYAPGFSKGFSPAAVEQGETATLRFTVDNSGNVVAAADLAFADAFPAGMALADPVNPANTCGGSLSADPGATSLALTGGALAAGASCTIDVDVRATGTGPLSNVTGDLTSTLPTAAPATAVLTVGAAAAPGFAMSFTPGTVDQGGISVLAFTIDNAANTIAASDLAFDNTLPAGLELADPVNAGNTCGGSLSADPGGTALSLSGGALAAGASCTIELDLRALAAGDLTNTSGPLTSSLPEAAPASATLSVTAARRPEFAKAFSPAVIDQGEISVLRYTIDNSAGAVAATDLAFSDSFPAGLVVARPTGAVNGCGGTLTAEPSKTEIALAGGSVAAGASCSIEMNVLALTPGTLSGTSSDLETSLGRVAGAQAALTVNAQPLQVSMSFAPATIEQLGTSTLIYTLTNSSQIGAHDITLSDTLPDGVSVAGPDAATTNCIGGALSAADGAGSVAYTGGALARMSSCQVKVIVSSAIEGSYANSLDSLTSTLGRSDAASATLTVEPATTGTLTIVQITDTDGAYVFSSAMGPLNFTITTTGGRGRAGPISVPAGSYDLRQATPDGVGNTRASCNDDDSTVQPRERLLTVNIAPLEAVTCTIASISSRQKTVDTINRFLTRRADLILSSEPSGTRRIDRLKRGMGGATPLSFANGDLNSFLPFSTQLSTAADSYTLSTSFQQMRQAAASLALAHGDQRGVRHIPNYRWDAWFEAQYKSFDSGPDSGHFAIAYFGADYLLTPDLLIGALVQIDDMKDDAAALASSVSGTGWMAGPYMTARVAPNLYFDARLAAGTSENDISPFNTYVDQFSTDRWMAMAGLTGDFQKGKWTVQPGASLSWFEEKQHAYLDSVGVAIPGQTVALGQIKIGPTVSGQFETLQGTAYAPFVSLDAIYNFGDTKGVTVTNPDSAVTDGWRGRVQAGVDFSLANGSSISFGGSYDGIGRGSLDVWGLTFDLSIPFQKPGVQ